MIMTEHALILGGGTGIGRATAVALADGSRRCVVAGRRLEKLEDVCTAYDGPGALFPRSVDVTDRQQLTELVGWFEQEIGPLSIVVNAAGMNIRDRTMGAMTPDAWDQVLAINATGAYNVLHAVLPVLRERKSGTVVQISSVAGKRALELAGVAYAASKFAMTALGTAVGQEEAKHGIRITNVYPGEVDTPLLDARPVPISERHRATILQPSHVARLIVTICELPPQAHVPEIVVKPLTQDYV